MITTLLLFALQDISVLVLDGQSNHNWKAMTPFMKAQLEKGGLCKVEVSTTPRAGLKGEERDAAWAKWRPAFKDHQVVVSNYNGEPWPEEVRTAFVEFVRGGGGFHVVHAANNAFSDWREYNDMIGLGWRAAGFGARVAYDDKGELVRMKPGEGPGAGHGPQHEFQVAIRDEEHPITKGLPKVWMHATDELYHGQRGPAENMQVLATAHSSREKGGTGLHEPMLWVIPFGKGRVVTNVLGHENGKSLQCVGFITILRRSVEWLATAKVTVPAPDNFPTGEKTSSEPK